MLRRENGVRSTAVILMLLGALAGSGCGKNSGTTQPGEGKTSTVGSTASQHSQNSKSAEADPEFVVPEGTSAEILTFVRKLGKRPPNFNTQQEATDYAIKIQKAIIRAADKILSKTDADDDIVKEALTRKFISTIGLSLSGAGDAPAKVLADTNRMREDSRPVVAAVANHFMIPARTLNLKTLSASEQSQLCDDAIERVVSSNALNEAIGDTAFLADQLEKVEQKEAAALLFERLAAAVTESAKDEKTLAMVPQLRGQANRIRLPGSELKLEGPLLSGGELDWDSYRGKVVLVDFWATWCGPCVAEIPNVQANYDKYHERGFDVLGISLDRNLRELEQFVERNKLPWNQLFDAASKKQKGWQHPMAVRYAVSTIPAAFLVDREGKVVSTNARGEELERQLEKIFGPGK